MRRPSHTTLILLLTIGIFVLPDRSPAPANSSQPSRPVMVEGIKQTKADLELPQLDFWPHCVSSRSFHSARPLCIKDFDSNRPYAVLGGLLDTGDLGADALCVIDSSVVMSQRECLQTESQKQGDRSAGGTGIALLLELAQNWRRLRVHERADQLYQRAYAVADRDNLSVLHKTLVVQEWISLKIARGDIDRARELARLQTSLTKEAFECDAGWAPSLKSALEFEAKVLDEIGDRKAAEIARQEAESLPAAPPPSESCVTLDCYSWWELRECEK